MSQIRVIGRAFVQEWTRRWTELSSSRFANDYEIAKLAAEIRREFPQGDSGILQFNRFVRANLRGTNGMIMGRKAAAFPLFTEVDWKTLGGWPGLSFLAALRKGERDRVIASLDRKVVHHYSTIRNHALKLGIVSRRKGRDTRSQAEDRVHRLQGWIVSLYKTVKGLPPMPKDVAKALTQKTLLGLAGKANALSVRS